MHKASGDTLRAGVAQRDISPRKPLFLVGYPYVPRTSTGIHDPLYTSALYLEHAEERVLLIALDLCYVEKDLACASREQLSVELGLPRQNILISTTHTHSGPKTCDLLMWNDDPTVPPNDPEYMDFLYREILSSARAAQAAVVPATLATTRTEVEGVGGNRLIRGGVRDPEVGILYLKKLADDQPLALTLIYSMHPTVLHGDSTLVSSDFPHYAREEIMANLPGVRVLYHNGATGDQSPRYFVKGQNFAEAERLGRKLGAAVVVAVGKLKPQDFCNAPQLAASHTFINLPPRRFPTLPEAKAIRAQALKTFERLQAEGAGHGPVRTAECAVFGAKREVILAQALTDGGIGRALQRVLPAEVQVLRIGEVLLAGVPGELFVDFILDIKRRAPDRAFVITMANGQLQGYIVTPAASAAGGYEASFTMFRTETGTLLADAAVDLMRQVSNHRQKAKQPKKRKQ